MKKKPLSLPAPQPKRPVLRFMPPAWAKLLFLRDIGPTEIGGFGLAAAGDLLLIEDIALVERSLDGGPCCIRRSIGSGFI